MRRSWMAAAVALVAAGWDGPARADYPDWQALAGV